MQTSAQSFASGCMSSINPHKPRYCKDFAQRRSAAHGATRRASCAQQAPLQWRATSLVGYNDRRKRENMHKSRATEADQGGEALRGTKRVRDAGDEGRPRRISMSNLRKRGDTRFHSTFRDTSLLLPEDLREPFSSAMCCWGELWQVCGVCVGAHLAVHVRKKEGERARARARERA